MIEMIDGDRFNPFTATESPLLISNEEHYVPSASPYYVQLHEIPNLTAITITGFTETAVTPSAPASGFIQVDRKYKTGLVRFPASAVNCRVLVTYYGLGTVIHADLCNQLILGYYPFNKGKDDERARFDMPMQAGMWHYHEYVDDFTWDRDSNDQLDRVNFYETSEFAFPDQPNHSSHFIAAGSLKPPGSDNKMFARTGGVQVWDQPGPLGSVFYTYPNSLPLRIHIRARTRESTLTALQTMTHFAGLFYLQTGNASMGASSPAAMQSAAAAFTFSPSLRAVNLVGVVIGESLVGTFPTSVTEWTSYTLDYTPGLVRVWVEDTLVGTFGSWITSPLAYMVPGYRRFGVNTNALQDAFYLDRIAVIPTGELLLP